MTFVLLAKCLPELITPVCVGSNKQHVEKRQRCFWKMFLVASSQQEFTVAGTLASGHSIMKICVAILLQLQHHFLIFVLQHERSVWKANQIPITLKRGSQQMATLLDWFLGIDDFIFIDPTLQLHFAVR